MPIRFRCVYCDQLLGIARRKAGTVVKCPNCAGQLIVPEADPAVVGASNASHEEATLAAPEKEGREARTAPAPAKSAATSDATEGGLLFERNDFDELLRPAVAKRGSALPAGNRSAPKVPENTFQLTDAADPVPVLEPVPAVTPGPPTAVPTLRRSGVFLSPLLIVLAIVFVFVSVSAAFILGLLIGRGIAH